MPEIIAHRGASRECLENTLAAFDRAVEQKADAIELDVHATRDGTVVVHHDPSIRDHRTGHADETIVIADVDYSVLSEWRLLNAEPVPTLDAVLNRMEGRAKVYVEVKGIGIEKHVVDCLHRHQKTSTAVHSFDHRIALAVRNLDENIRVGILSASYVIDYARLISTARATEMWQQESLIDAALVATVQSSGARLIAWTENNASHAALLAQLGVDALCTDIPAALRASLATHA